MKLPNNYLCAANYAKHCDIVYSPRLGRTDNIPAVIKDSSKIYFDVSYASCVLEWVDASKCQNITLVSAENDWHVGPQGQFYTNEVVKHGRCLAIQPVPSNVIAWYTPNPASLDYPMRWIPIGLQNPYTTTGITKESIESTELVPYEQRDIEMLVCFNTDTYPATRNKVLDDVKKGSFLPDFEPTIIEEEITPVVLAALMANSKTVLCPKGNGSDTHRIYEAMYLGAIPLVDPNHPILRYTGDLTLPDVLTNNPLDMYLGTYRTL